MINAKSIASSIKAALDASTKHAAPVLSGIITLCALLKRPGLSTIRSVINVVSYLKEHGISTDPNADGTPNSTIILTYGIINEIYRSMREDANFQLFNMPGSMMIKSSGVVTPGGTVECVGTNLDTGKGQVACQ